MLNGDRARRVPRLDASSAHIHLLDYGDALLKPFSDKAHDYVAKVLDRQGRRDPPRHRRQGGRDRPCRPLRRHARADAVRRLGWRDQGRARRRRLRPRAGPRRPRRRRAGPDAARQSRRLRDRRRREHPRSDGRSLPQLGSVALQSGIWAADNILADFAGKPRSRSRYQTRGSWR